MIRSGRSTEEILQPAMEGASRGATPVGGLLSFSSRTLEERLLTFSFWAPRSALFCTLWRHACSALRRHFLRSAVPAARVPLAVLVSWRNAKGEAPRECWDAFGEQQNDVAIVCHVCIDLPKFLPGEIEAFGGFLSPEGTARLPT